MEKNKILKEANEALQRTLLMMNYDMKKTLSENVEVISEQANEISAGDLEDFVDDAVDILDRDVETSDMEDLIDLMKTNIFGKKFKGKCAYDKFLSYYKDNESFQFEDFESEVNSTGEFGEQGFDDLKQELLDLITKEKQFCKGGAQTPASGETAKTGVFDCIPKNSSTTTGKYQGQNIVRVVGASSMIVYWQDGHWTQYVYDVNTKKVGTETKRGTFKCEGGKLTKTESSNKSGGSTGGGKTSAPAITDKNLLSTLNFEYSFPGDKTYVYDFVPNTTVAEQTGPGGTWYAKNVKTGKVFDITKYFPKTAEKLNIEYPSAANPIDKSPKNLDTTSGEKTTTTDVSNIQGKKLEVQPVGSKIDPTQKIDLTTKTTTMKPTTPDLSNLDYYGPATESLKKTLKKNLKVVKENKENLMVETNIVEKRFNFIVEGKIFETINEQDYLVESVITEIGYLKAQGYTSKAINEGLFSMLGSLLGGGAKAVPAVFGEYIANWLTGKLGIPKNSYMNGVIVSLVGNLNISDYDRFFSDCRFSSNKIADSLIEGYLVQLQNQKDVNSGASGFIVSALRNSVVDYFAEDKNSLIQILEDKIGEFLCPKLSKLSGAISDKTDEMKAKMVA
jgi:hypothetical protein